MNWLRSIELYYNIIAVGIDSLKAVQKSEVSRKDKGDMTESSKSPKDLDEPQKPNDIYDSLESCYR